MDEVQCLVDECDGVPLERLTVDTYGLLLVYAICRPHAVAVRDGAMVAVASKPSRGLIGVA